MYLKRMGEIEVEYWKNEMCDYRSKQQGLDHVYQENQQRLVS